MSTLPLSEEERSSQRLRAWLLATVFVLVFEGVLRKIAPGLLKIPIFFLKDFMVFVGGIMVLRRVIPKPIIFLWRAYLVTAVLFIPVLVVSSLFDFRVGAYGAERYLLFPAVAFQVWFAFAKAQPEQIKKFFYHCAFLVGPTSLLVILQSRLPPDHWLNMSVTGQNLEVFSANGLLRLSSTFPFSAQYAFFLNVEVFILITALSLSGKDKRWRVLLILLVPLLMSGMYLTISRTAVIGSESVILLGIIFAFARGQRGMILNVSLLGVLLYGSYHVALILFPDALEAYAAREEGPRSSYMSQEVLDRTYETVFGWATSDSFASRTVFGHGLGVMSNGIEQISSYARSWRMEGNWTETDYATTMFEGGFYLIFVWYGFRYYVIYQTTKRYLLSPKGPLITAGAFCQGYIVLEGFLGTLALQPPLAIWWWLAVGFALVFWHRASISVEDGQPGPIEAERLLPPRRVLPRGRSSYADQLHAGR